MERLFHGSPGEVLAPQPPSPSVALSRRQSSKSACVSLPGSQAKLSGEEGGVWSSQG